MLILVDGGLNLTIERLGGDGKGGFVFVRCKVYSGGLALVSICGPSGTDGAFLAQISGALLEGVGCPLVVGGDFGAVVDPALDGSRSGAAANPSSRLLSGFISELGLIDLWRVRNAKAGDFTFFSSGHGTFSGMDYIFLSPSLVSSNSSVSILPILLSDRSAVLCSVPLSDVEAGSPRWRFNISLLSDQTFITTLEEYIKEFLEIDVPSGVDPRVLWEATRCAMRGFCVSSLLLLPGRGLTSLHGWKVESSHCRACGNGVLLGGRLHSCPLWGKSVICFHTQGRSLFYIGLDGNVVLSRRDLVICWPLGWKSASLGHMLARWNHRMIGSPRTLWQLVTCLKVFARVCVGPRQILMNQFVSSI